MSSPDVKLRVQSLEFEVGDRGRFSASGSLRSGERLAILGPSGCGKTTFLKTLAGLLPSKAERLEVDGRDIRALEPDQRSLSFVFQGGALFPHLSAEENIALALKYHPSWRRLSGGDRKRRVSAFLESAALDPQRFAARSLASLSGGERQRIALLRALVVEPSLILMDEALTALDAASKQSLLAWMLELFTKAQTTLIFVTHNQEEAVALGTRSFIWENEAREILF
jgi:putative spermidine/putrescine transport system ATP-binding protein